MGEQSDGQTLTWSRAKQKTAFRISRFHSKNKEQNINNSCNSKSSHYCNCKPNIQSKAPSSRNNMVSQQSPSPFRSAVILALVSLLAVARTTTAFTIVPQSSAAVQQSWQASSQSSTSRLLAESWDGTSSSGGGTGGIEQVEYKIFADGRVEETVRGIKGNNCHKVTDQISSKLGEVVATSPTEEMYEQEVVLDQTVKQTEGTGDSFEGGSSW
jgi:hypothetical protein